MNWAANPVGIKSRLHLHWLLWRQEFRRAPCFKQLDKSLPNSGSAIVGNRIYDSDRLRTSSASLAIDRSSPVICLSRNTGLAGNFR